jgi:hypothetical protein
MPAPDLHGDTTRSEAAGYERRDLDPGAVGLFGLALVVVLAIAVAIASLLIHYKTVQQARQETPMPRLAREREAPAKPRLQVDAPNELRQMRAAEEAVLNSYGWADKNAGIVRIPVERAMEILAKKGLPARKQEEKQ